MRERMTHLVRGRSTISIVISVAVLVISYLNYSDSPLQSGLLVLIWLGTVLMVNTNVDDYIVTAIWGAVPTIGGIYMYATGTDDVWLVGLGTGIGFLILLFSFAKPVILGSKSLG